MPTDLICFKCGKSDGALFRQNEKGVPGIWACDAHNQAERDPVLEEVTAIVEKTIDKPTVH
jgi:hypothetical protein